MRMIRALGRGVAVLMALAVGLAGVAAAQDLVTFGTTRIEVVAPTGDHRTLEVELASTPEQLTQGLMYRRSLAADGGMLFDFGRSQPVSMWMKNTLIPLDMVFIAADGAVVGVAERTVPQSLSIIASPEPVRAVLEVNGGAASRLGLGVGSHLVHPLFQP